ncbi:MAG TPA: Cu(I)-responsive transcriptional regulator [Kiloniellales bacterium]|nr:Cu(I)-responsive transcriptional regulator [Kiloniellales bacterium]
MQIGTIARKSGVPAKTIRYYESIGLIDAAARTGSGYRVYDARDLQTLRFIQRARSLGFSVSEVNDLLALWRDRERRSADVKAVAKRHLGDIDCKIAELQGMCHALEHLVEACHGDERPDCPILDDLAGDAALSGHHAAGGGSAN